MTTGSSQSGDLPSFRSDASPPGPRFAQRIDSAAHWAHHNIVDIPLGDHGARLRRAPAKITITSWIPPPLRW